MKNRIIAILLTLILIYCDNVIAFAATDISGTDLTSILATNYDSLTSSTDLSLDGTTRVIVASGQHAAYTVNVTRAGVYKLLVYGKYVGSAPTVTVSGVAGIYGVGISATTDRICTMGRCYLNAGANSIVLTATSGTINIKTIYLKSVERDVAAAGVTTIEAHDYYSADLHNANREDIQAIGYTTAAPLYVVTGPVFFDASTSTMATYKLNVAQSGSYKLTLYAGCTTQAVDLVLNNKYNSQISQATVPITTTDDRNCKAGVFENFNLQQGSQEITIKRVSITGTNTLGLYYFLLERVGDVKSLAISETAETQITPNQNFGISGTTTINWDNTVALSTGQWISYDIGITKAGNYKFLANAKTVSPNVSLYVDNEVVSTRSLGNNSTDRNHTLGRANLTVGTHTIKILVNSGTVTVNNFRVKCVDLVIAQLGETMLEAEDYLATNIDESSKVDAQWNYASTTSYENTGCIYYDASKYTDYNFNLVAGGWYTLTLYEMCVVDTTRTLTISNNGNTLGSAAVVKTASASTVVPLVAGNIHLNTGMNTIRIQADGGSTQFAIYCFKLTLTSPLSISETGETTITPNQNFGIEGTTTINMDNTVALSTGQWISYDIGITKAGNYKFLANAKTVTPNVSLYVDNAEVSTRAIGNNTTDRNHTLGRANLTVGTHTIKFLVNSGTVTVNNFRVKCVDLVIAPSGLTTLEAEDYLATNITESSRVDAQWNYASTTSYANTGCIYFDANNYADYNFNLANAGHYRLTLYQTCSADTTRTLTVSNNGTTLGSASVVKTGSAATVVPVVVGDISLNAGLNTIRIQADSGSTLFSMYYFTLYNSDISGEVVALYDGNGNSVSGVTAGSMTATASLNGYFEGKDVFFCFAIYKMDATGNVNLYKVASQTVNVANFDTTFEKEINGITLEQGCAYTAKVFIWNNMIGKCFSYKALPPVYRNIYVSENGNDTSGDGTLNAPFKSISKAKVEIASINSNQTGDIVVNILPGYYKLTQTEEFGVAHSGKNGFNVIIRGSDPQNPPIISGGIEVAGWTRYNSTIWKAPLHNVDYVRNLYINGYSAVRAKSECCYTYIDDYNVAGSVYAKDGFTVSSTNFPVSFARPSDLELVWNVKWKSHRTPVNSITRNADNVVFIMKQPVFTFSSDFSPGQTFYIENAMELLDKPGEFYYNKAEEMIYYYPYNEEDMTTAESYVGDTELMFKICGTSPQNKVENLIFDNLKIRYGAYNFASEFGYIGTQSDALRGGFVAGDGRTGYAAQFAVDMADNIKIKNCEFSCLGSAAISMIDGVSNSAISGNIIRDVSGTGIRIGTQDHYAYNANMEVCQNIDIKNNVLRRIASEFFNNTAISVYYEKNINVCNNDISDTPYTGITAGWGWENSNPFDCSNINISNNRIQNVMTTLDDGGSIYTLGKLTGSTIKNNYLTKCLSGTGGSIYLDAGSSHLEVCNNVVEKCFNWLQIQAVAYNTHELNVHDNFSDIQKCIIPSKTERMANSITFENPESLPSGGWTGVVATTVANAGLESGYASLLTSANLPVWMQKRIDAPKFTYTGGITISALNISYSSNTVSVYSDSIGFKPNDWLAYDVYVPEAGAYQMDVYSSLSSGIGEVQVFNNYVYQCTGSIVGSGTNTISNVGTLNMTLGKNTIIIRCSGSTGFNLKYFAFLKM